MVDTILVLGRNVRSRLTVVDILGNSGERTQVRYMCQRRIFFTYTYILNDLLCREEYISDIGGVSLIVSDMQLLGLINRMKFLKSINSPQQFNRLISFDSSQTEHYRIYKQSGSSFVVDFKYTIIPRESHEIKVFYEETPDNFKCIPFIFQGVESFLKKLNSNGISIKGFDMEVYDCVLHEIDFRPNRHTIYSAMTFYRLAFDRGIKSIRRVECDFQEPLAESFNSFLHSSNKLETDHSKYFRTSIHLPNRGLPTRSLKQNAEIQYEKSNEDNQLMKIRIFRRTSVRHDNIISIHTKKGVNSSEIIDSVFQELIQLKFDIYSRDYDLTGFEIFLECPDLKYADREIGRQLYWDLLELLE